MARSRPEVALTSPLPHKGQATQLLVPTSQRYLDSGLPSKRTLASGPFPDYTIQRKKQQEQCPNSSPHSLPWGWSCQIHSLVLPEPEIDINNKFQSEENQYSQFQSPLNCSVGQEKNSHPNGHSYLALIKWSAEAYTASRLGGWVTKEVKNGLVGRGWTCWNASSPLTQAKDLDVLAQPTPPPSWGGKVGFANCQ